MGRGDCYVEIDREQINLGSDKEAYYSPIPEWKENFLLTSDDGLNYTKKPWAWDDGELLEMSTTQQHWLTHSDALFLVK